MSRIRKNMGSVEELWEKCIKVQKKLHEADVFKPIY
jgi:hypothetical protein